MVASWLPLQRMGCSCIGNPTLFIYGIQTTSQGRTINPPDLVSLMIGSSSSFAPVLPPSPVPSCLGPASACSCLTAHPFVCLSQSCLGSNLDPRVQRASRHSNSARPAIQPLPSANSAVGPASWKIRSSPILSSRPQVSPVPHLLIKPLN